MSAVPTIVAGLFIYSLLILQLGQERSGFAASMALSVSMIPVVTTTAEVVLRLVPNGLREASLALGTTQWQTVRRVVLPTARPGLVTAVLLGVARVIGETSPVLLVAGVDQRAQLRPDPRPAAVAAAVRVHRHAACRSTTRSRAPSVPRSCCSCSSSCFRPRPDPRRPRARPRQPTQAAPPGPTTTGRAPPDAKVSPSDETSARERLLARRAGGLACARCRAGTVRAPARRPRPTCRSRAPARPGARSPSTPGVPTCAPAVWSSTTPAPARPTVGRSSSRARSTSRTPRSRSRTRRSPASRPRSRSGPSPTCRWSPVARRSCTT